MDTEQKLKKIEALLKGAKKPSQGSSTEGEKASAQTADTVVNRTAATNPASPEPVAIIGLSAKFPGCQSVEDFWAALQNNTSLIEQLPKERIDFDSLPEVFTQGLDMEQLRWGGIVPDAMGFDAAFFDIPEGDAQLMDPRQRILMMSIYNTLEDAGYAPSSFRQSATALFLGVEDSEYAQTLHEMRVDPGLFNSPNMIANSIAYLFDFRGPSEFINTMCSSAAIALHRAVMCLRNGEAQQAIVGAANLMLRPEPFLGLARMGQLSDSNNVASFGDAASGYLRADGVASVLLKPLSKAEADGDAIYATIKNSAVNFNGQGGMSFATPNIPSHMAVIEKCYSEAAVDIRDISYIEAQGMATPVSDMVEWNAFNRALSALAEKQGVGLTAGKCAVSTVKPQMGHMHAASAFGALFKVIGSLKNDALYPILNFADISADLDTENQPCRLLSEVQSWTGSASNSATGKRLAGIHSYGIGGNNAHLLIEEYQASDVAVSGKVLTEESPQIIPLTATSPEQCKVIAGNLLALLKQTPTAPLASVAKTLQQGRDELPVKLAIVANDLASLMEILTSFVDRAASDESAIDSLYISGTSATASEGSTDSSALSWVNGEQIQWPDWRKQTAVKTLHLPVYPFELQTFTVEGPAIYEGGFDLATDSDGADTSSAVRFDTFKDDQTLNDAEKITSFITSFLASEVRMSADAIDAEQPMQHFGVDSIVTAKLVQSIKVELGVKLTGRDLLHCSTVASLTTLVAERRGDADESSTEAEQQKQLELEQEKLRNIELLNQFKSGEIDLEAVKNLVK